MKNFVLPVLALLSLSSTPIYAWFPQGHSIIAESATKSLPADVPAWFRDGAKAIAHSAQDPDIHKNRDLPMMTEIEAPQHYFDWELLGNRPLPHTRREFAKLCADLKIEPSNIGELPYALAEWTQRLTVTFAEARRFPDNVYIQQKALVYAGILSHYSGDCTMPLHVTIHHDGMVGSDGKSPKTGIHARVDSLIERLKFTPTQLVQTQVQPTTDLWKEIENEMTRSRAQIGRTYELESALPFVDEAQNKSWKASPALRAFALERGRAASGFTARLFLTAWRDSAKVKLPTWLER